MSIINNGLLLAAEAAAAGGYEISRSLRFNSPDSAYLSRTPASAGNRKTWTWAGWVKRSKLGISATLFASRPTSSPLAIFYFSDQDYLRFDTNSNSFGSFQTNAVFRDCSAWYHVVFAADSSQSTDTNRLKLYVNGVQQTFASASYPSQNTDGQINTATLHGIGAINPSTYTDYFDGYLADIYFIDGQALDPTSFGEFDTNGVWQPIEYTGSYGTNGFHLPFSDNSGTSSTTLGKDAAGSNNWTPNNFSVAAGSGNDSLVDVPTASGTDTGAGGEVRGNYCTWNPLCREGSRFTFRNGNLNLSGNSIDYGVSGTMFVPKAGKWYFELTFNSGVTYTEFGIVSAQAEATDMFDGSLAGGLEYGGPVYGFVPGYGPNLVTQTTSSAWSGVSVSAPTTGDVYGVAVDFDNEAIYFAKNGTWLNSGDPTSGASKTGAAFTSIAEGNYSPGVHDWGSADSLDIDLNTGQRAFAYSAPSGYKCWCTTNLPTPTIEDGSTVMDVKLYTGDGSAQTISGLNFSPDLVWVKSRSNAEPHVLFDTVRGVPYGLSTSESGGTVAEFSEALASFNSDGWSYTSASSAALKSSGYTYVGWAWDAGSSTVTNNDGSISSQVRANASAGFSVVTYTANAPNNTIGHGLGVTPQFVITKNRDSADAWYTYHASLGVDKYIVLSSTAAAGSSTGYWGTSANWTSSTFGVNTNGAAGNNYGSDDLVAYCFAPVAGYSAFGSYTGNGSTDGPFVYTGFRPKWIMSKRTDASGNNWVIIDAERDAYNVSGNILQADTSNSEFSVTSYPTRDILSNGFKARSATVENVSGGTYIYCAFAESPFAYARAR